MFSALPNYLSLAAAYVRLNFRSQLEYRGAFLSQVVAMFINNCIWTVFWCFFFHRFPVLRGWTLTDYITLWALSASGFGLAGSFLGNGLHLARIIARGELDSWLLYPRALLPHLLLGKMSATAIGDVLFGYAVYLVMVRPDLQHFFMFCVLTVAVATVFAGFNIASGSLSFYLGNAEALSEQWLFAMITFSTYPATLFEGSIKFVLFTIIPAGFISYLPVASLRHRSCTEAALACAGALVVLAAGVAMFHHGLRRYESGNLMEMRG